MRLPLVFATSALLLAAGCSGNPEQSAQHDLASGNAHMVTVAPNGQLAFDPRTLTISAGETVTWTWGASGHTVTSGPPGSPDGKFCSPSDGNCASATPSSAGAVYTHTFAQTGSYPYFCLVHGGLMTGTITVQ